MLKKLLKYDLINIYKLLIIFYSLSIISSIITRILFNIDNSLLFNVLAQISSGFTISMIANILINNLMKLWARFISNIYKDESYLTHTLPVTKKEIYTSKVLTTVITLLTSVIVIIISLFIAYYSKENLEILKNILLPLANIYNSTILSILAITFITIFIQLITIIQTGFNGIILGHKHNKNKTVLSIVYGVITYTIVQLFTLLIIYIFGLFNNNIMDLFLTTNITDPNLLKDILYLAIVIYTFVVIILYIINIKLFKKGVNID